MCFWLQVTEYAIKSGLNKEENSYAQKQEHLQDVLNQWLKDDTKDLGSSCLSVCQPRWLAFPLSLLPCSSKVVSVVLDPMFSYNPVGRQKRGHFSLIVFLSEGSLFIRSSLADSPLSCYGQGITSQPSQTTRLPRRANTNGDLGVLNFDRKILVYKGIVILQVMCPILNSMSLSPRSWAC